MTDATIGVNRQVKAKFGRLKQKLKLRTRARRLRGAIGRDPDSEAAGRALLKPSPLFDLAWYNAQLPKHLRRRRAIKHYLREGRLAGLTPHALFDPETYHQALPEHVGTRDPLCVYLSGRYWHHPTHPLFDPATYLAEHPEAGDHPGGPIVHYLAIGRHNGARPNTWFAGDDFLGFLTEQRDLWLARREAHTAAAAIAVNESIPWDQLSSRAQVAGRVSVLIPTYKDWAMTTLAVERIAQDIELSGGDVDIVVIDNGCGLAASTALASLRDRFPGTQLVANAVNHGFALGNNLGLAVASGELIVFLNNDTEVQIGWLAPLRAALCDTSILAAQSLLIFPSGTIQSAGISFPDGGGIPHEFLAGFPTEDAQGIDSLSFQALTGAALAVRFSDAVALHGFDPIYRNGMEDSDFCLRLLALRPGRLTVRPDSRVTHHESKTPGRFAAVTTNRQAFMDRWEGHLVGDDEALWSAAGYRVVDRVASAHEPRLAQRRPVLERIGRVSFTTDEPEPRLRWAIKIAAPAGNERWGDTHYARHLARHLRERGQDVVIDFRQEFDRATGKHDDVVLVLRGLERYYPAAEQINLLWLISHPELLTRTEAGEFDRVFAASAPWAHDRTQLWDMRVEPLLQATDTTVFRPDVAEPDTGHAVVFVGGSRRQERPLVLNALAGGLPLTIYGHDWEQYVPADVIRQTYLPNDDVPATYRSASFVLNDHWPEMRDDGFLSNRLFDAVGVGARVITDNAAGLHDVFGKNVQVAETVADLIGLVNAPNRDEIFGDETYRLAEADRIHAEHSFVARSRTLLDSALEVRRQRRH